jgi:DNA-binding response OmpR family regulator
MRQERPELEKSQFIGHGVLFATQKTAMCDRSSCGVLIVDDNADQCRALSLLLRSRGYCVNAVQSGSAALDFVAANPTDLVLLDMMMPEMSGLEVLGKIRSNRAWDSVRICMYSAVDDPRWRAEANRLGAEEYIVKGKFDLDELFERIDHHLRNHC